MEAARLNHGRTGNLSVRDGDGMLVTPSGVPAADLDAGSMVSMGLDGQCPEGQLRPSSEWRLHAAVYRARADLAAVVHAHSPHATALSCARRAIPAFHYMVGLGGSSAIPCAGYATFGSEALAATVVDALGHEARACLMANHGMLAAGADLDAALALAIDVEHLSRVFLLTLQAGGPVILDDAEMTRVMALFADYGQPP